MGAEGDLSLGSEHTVEYTDDRKLYTWNSYVSNQCYVNKSNLKKIKKTKDQIYYSTPLVLARGSNGGNVSMQNIKATLQIKESSQHVDEKSLSD